MTIKELFKQAFDSGYDYRTSLMPEIIKEYGENCAQTFDEWYDEQKLNIHSVMQSEGSDVSEEAAVGKEREAQSQSAGNSESASRDIGDFVPMIWMIEKLRWPPEKRVTMNELIAKVQNEFTFTIKRKSSEEAL